MATSVCPMCDRPVHGAVLCQACTDALAHALRQVPGLIRDLDVTISRQDRVTPGRASRGGDPALRVDTIEARDVLEDTIRAWAAVLGEEGEQPYGLVPTLAVWLSLQARTIRLRDWAGTMADEVHAAITQAQRAIDRPSAGIRIRCHVCASRVTLDPDQELVTCRMCGQWGTISWWRSQVAPETLTPMTAAQVIDWVREAHHLTVTREQLRQWVHRGHLTPIGHQHGDRGQPASLYDAADVALLAQARHSPRQAART